MGRIRALLQRVQPAGGLAEKTVKGGAWVSAATTVQRVVTLSTFVVLARLLTPSAFGLAGIALFVLAALRQLSRLGLADALVQRETDDPGVYLDTAWLIAVARGVGLAALAVAFAPIVASAFGTPRLEPLLYAIAVVPLLDGLGNPGLAYLERDLAFHRTAAYRLGRTGSRAAVGIGFASVSPTAWAIVAGVLAGAVIGTVLSYVVHPHRPRLRFDTAAARDLLSFGKWITGSGFLLFGLNRGDDLVVGWLLAPAALGFFQQAFRVSNAPATQISSVLSRVAYPTFTVVAADPPQLREAVVRAVRLVSLVAVPTSAGVILVARPFVRAILGPDWLPMVPVVYLFAAWALLRALLSLCGPLFKAVDRPAYSTALQAVRLVVLAALLVPATARLGIVGAAAAVLASGLVQAPLATFVAVRTIDVDFRRLLSGVVTPALATVVMAACTVAVGHTFAESAAMVRLVAMVGTGIVTYVAALFAIERVFGTAVREDAMLVRDSLSPT